MNQGVEILIVEDSPTEAEQVKHLLEERGFAITLATDGQEALARARRRKPALIICDIVMPAMDGYTLCKKIKSSKSTRDTPVVLVSALPSLQELIKGLECGADNFMRKPYDEKSLLSCISSTLANRVMRKGANTQAGAVVRLADQRHVITSGRQQILDFLISTHEHGVLINGNLSAREKQLAFSHQCLNGLTRISETLNRCTSEQEVAAQALRRALELPNVQAGWISLQHEGEAGFRIASAHGLPPALQAPGGLEGDCLCRRKLLSGELIRATNILECERLQMATGDTCGLRYHASVPLWIGNRTVGIMNLAGAEQGLFSDEGLNILHGVGNQIGIALERARLYNNLEKQVEERTAALTAEIADRKRAQEALREANDTLEAVIQASPMGITILDSDANVKLWNPAAERIFGWRKEEVLGRPLPSIPPHKSEELRAFRERLLRGDAFSDTEVVRQKKDGSLIDVSLSTAPLRDAKGDISGAMGIMADITERRRALAELEQTRQQQLQMKDQFLSHISHELRSPLSAIHQFATILLDGLAGDLSPEQRDYLEIMLKNANQLGTMIEDLLEVARAQTGKLSVVPQATFLAPLIDETLCSLRATAAAKGIALSIDIPGHLPPVYADPQRVRQILINLIENGIKFTSEGGSVSVAARQVHSSEVIADRAGAPDREPSTINCEQRKDFIEISVADTGCGISREEREKIFEELYQVKSTNTASRRGLGLGLRICKELVSRHGGRIWVGSQLGRGSTFFFTLPTFSLAKLLAPITTADRLQKGSVALIAVQVCPLEKRLLTETDETALWEARNLLERCLLPDLDLLLPRIVQAKWEEIFFIVACADHSGVKALIQRIQNRLGRCEDLLQAGLTPTVSFTIFDISSMRKNTPFEQVVTNVVSMIENLVETVLDRGGEQHGRGKNSHRR